MNVAHTDSLADHVMTDADDAADRAGAHDRTDVATPHLHGMNFNKTPREGLADIGAAVRDQQPARRRVA